MAPREPLPGHWLEDGAPARVRLLEVQPALGHGLSPTQRRAAEAALSVPAVTLGQGAWDPASLGDARGVRGPALGALVTKGVVAMEVTIAQAPCCRLLLAGDRLMLDAPQADPMPLRWRFSVVSERATLAVLDDRFLAVASRWPRLLHGMSIHAAGQARSGLVHQAISQLPRVDQRLLALLWKIADVHGRTTPHGRAIDLALTHAQLGAMIGAKRPTVSLGLARLADNELVSEHEGVWLLAPGSLGRLLDTSQPTPRHAAS